MGRKLRSLKKKEDEAAAAAAATFAAVSGLATPTLSRSRSPTPTNSSKKKKKSPVAKTSAEAKKTPRAVNGRNSGSASPLSWPSDDDLDHDVPELTDSREEKGKGVGKNRQKRTLDNAGEGPSRKRIRDEEEDEMEDNDENLLDSEDFMNELLTNDDGQDMTVGEEEIHINNESTTSNQGSFWYLIVY